MSRRFYIRTIAIFYLLINSLTVFCQNNSVQLQSDTKREEIQRYFGYEVLPVRYLSLPYDASININQPGDFVDIGFLFLLFIPILLLASYNRNKLAYFLTLAATMLLYIISTASSYIFALSQKENLNRVNSNVNELTSYLTDKNVDFLAEPTAHISAYLYYLSHLVYDPLESYLLTFTGDSDSITYPLLFLLFIGIIHFVRKGMSFDGSGRSLLVIVYCINLFFWLSFSAGIVWYGFVNIFLGLVVIYYLIRKLDYQSKSIRLFLKSLFFVCSIGWVISSIALRISMIRNNEDVNTIGKSMLNKTFFEYQIGEKNNLDVLQEFYPGFDRALAKINSETESKILRIGTSFTYFIKNNSERVYLDNQLGKWSQLKDRYEKKNLITDVLKSMGVKYIIVDLNTPFIDKTPEKTLQLKYRRLRRWIRDHEYLRLLATDRIVEEVTANGEVVYYYKMFGEKVVFGGQYAIYEII